MALLGSATATVHLQGLRRRPTYIDVPAGARLEAHERNGSMLTKHVKFRSLTFAIVLVAIALSVFCLEFFLRLIGLGDPVIYEENLVWKYSLLENQMRYRFRNNIVKVNGAGLRADKEWVKDKNNKLILFMGDSVTYGGSRIDNKELFSEKICRHLGQEFTCGNSGTNAYGVLNMVLRSRYDERIANADVVIFVVVAGDFLRGLSSISSSFYFTSSLNKILPAIEEVLNYVGWRYDINRYINSRRRNDDVKFDSGQKLNATEFALQNLKQEVLRLMSENKKVFLFYSPSELEVYNDNFRYRKIKERVLDGAVDIYDMTEEFRNNSKLKIYVDNIHYDIEGHSLVANIIHRYLEKRGVR